MPSGIAGDALWPAHLGFRRTCGRSIGRTRGGQGTLSADPASGPGQPRQHSRSGRSDEGRSTNCLEKPIEPGRLRSAIEVELCQRPEPASASCHALTKTETEVLNLILTGRTTAEAAAVLHRSGRTVEVHRRHIMRKFQATSVVDLVRRAVKMGLVDLAEWGR